MSESEFRFVHPVHVRFKDVDVGGHAHHSHALVYFEEARAAYWEQVTGRVGTDAVDYILAEISARYHSRIFWPQTLQVGVRVDRLTRKTFDMVYEVRTESGELAVSGRSTQVMYDYDRSAVTEMPVSYGEAIAELDGPAGEEPSSRS